MYTAENIGDLTYRDHTVQVGDLTVRDVDGYSPAGVHVRRVSAKTNRITVTEITVTVIGDRDAQGEPEVEHAEAQRYPLGPKEYAGLFVALVAAVLGVSGLLIRHSERAAPGFFPSVGDPGGSSSHHFNGGPAIVALFAALVALWLAWWIAGRFLRPLHAMNTAAQEISATNLHRRLGLDGPEDELTELGRTLEDLFGRLEASFESQRHFVANASHELRTPLAGHRTLLQVVLADPDATTEALRAACEEALQLGEQQERLIDALLTLATSERGVERWEHFDLGNLAETVLLGRRQDAERRDIHVDAALGRAPALGDPRLVESLVANLVDNALQHNMAGGQIQITTTSVEGGAYIAVSNSGPVVPPAEVERLFQPLQQTGSERVGHTDGHGLGLAIVQAIAKAHGAKVTVRQHPKKSIRAEMCKSGSRGIVKTCGSACHATC